MIRNLIFGAGVATGIAASMFTARGSNMPFRGKTALVTGGSRGLGLLLARELLSRGAHVAISARDPQELARAKEQLDSRGREVLPIEADMTMREETESAVQKVIEHFGALDILINNAGVISVGPSESMTIDDYRTSINTHFWGPYFATMAALPAMKKRRAGRIVNISSIGGKISIPHLLPYSVGKFALTGFSEGLRAELLKDKVYVTTVCPGLMRTGSPRNALFKGNNEAEYTWFTISDSLPLISMSANTAARRIIDASGRGDAEVILSVPARLATIAHALFPDTTIDFLGLVNRLLPAPGGIGQEARTGKQSSSKTSRSWITTLTQQAAQENNQII